MPFQRIKLQLNAIQKLIPIKRSSSNPIISIQLQFNFQKKNPRENLPKINFKIVSDERNQK